MTSSAQRKEPILHPNRETRAALSVMAAGLVSPDILAAERELYSKKWFEYSFMSPYEATDLFAKAYKEASLELSRQHDLAVSYSYERPLPARWWSDRREATNLWKARQQTDYLGLPYRFAISNVMEFRMNASWRHLPRPNQLYGGKFRSELIEYLKDEWEGWKSKWWIYDDPKFRNENFRGLPPQIEYRRNLLSLLNESRYPPSIARSYFVDRLLPEDMIRAAFGDEVVEKGRNDCMHEDPVPEVLLEWKAFQPACFMVPHAFDEAAPECSACPFRKPCRTAQPTVLRKVVEMHGHLDPKKARSAEQNQRRVQKSRAKTKAQESAQIAKASDKDADGACA